MTTVGANARSRPRRRGGAFRFMKRPRQTWFFVYNVPRDLRGKLLSSTGRAKDKIVESLGTKDPGLARERRDERIVYWNRQFRLLGHEPSKDDMRHGAYRSRRSARTVRLEQQIIEKSLLFIESGIEPGGYVYRHYHPSGDLLYVGKTLYAVGRQRQHLKAADWRDMICRILIEPFETREEA
jgi:hypothetical protein